MITAPKADTKPRELVPVGNHVARLFKIVNIGTVPTPYLNEDGSVKEQSRIRLYFELPHEMRDFEKDGVTKSSPMAISKEVTLSFYKSEKMTSTLRLMAHALIGTKLTDQEAEVFDVEDLLNKACMVEVTHETMKDGKEFAKAISFGSIPKGMEVPEQINAGVVQDVYKMTEEEVEALPEWLRDKMKTSREYHVRFLAPRSETPQAVDEMPDSVREAQELEPGDMPFEDDEVISYTEGQM